jgi:hypothetical protein
MDCIICQDSGSEKLQENTACSCKYKCHQSCWIDYVNSKTPTTCPLCRKVISVKPIVQPQQNQPTAPPYTPQERIPTQEIGQQISYQEFVDIIHQYNSAQNTVIQVRPNTQQVTQVTQQVTQATQQPVSQKVVKGVVGLCILAAIITIFSVYLG